MLEMNDAIFDGYAYTLGWVTIVIALFCVFIHLFVLVPENIKRCCKKDEEELMTSPKVLKTAKRGSLKEEMSPKSHGTGLGNFKGAA